jgi:hypothetical protein
MFKASRNPNRKEQDNFVPAAELRAAQAWVRNNVANPTSLMVSVSKHLIEA